MMGKPTFTLNNYFDLLRLKNLHFIDYLKNSFIIGSIASVWATLFSALSAFTVVRLRFKGENVFVLIVLGLSMFPQISMVGYLFRLLTKLRWINTYHGLILPYIALSLPLGLWSMMSYFSQIPRDFDKAALIDGATPVTLLFRIILPISLPGLLSTFLLLFIFCFNEFLFALILTTDFHAQTVPVGIAFFKGIYGQVPWGYIMAFSTLSALPVIGIGLFLQRFIIQGLTGKELKL